MNPVVEAAIIAGCFGVLTVIGTLAVQLHSTRRTSRDTKDTLREQLTEQRAQLDRTLTEQRTQLDRTLAEQREQLDRTLAEQRTRTLNDRFATASEQLGSDKPAAVQLAGVHAMAGLADDWEENRQTCVDVLCAYLRLPYRSDPGGQDSTYEQLAFRGNREVRHTVIRVITAHLKDGAAVSWQGLNFDFAGVVFDGGDFNDAIFSDGEISFRYAEFSGGTVDLGGAEFSGGKADFDGAKFSSGTVVFEHAKFSGGRVSFHHAEFSGGKVYFGGAQFSGGKVYFGGAQFSGGKVYFGGALITPAARPTSALPSSPAAG